MQSIFLFLDIENFSDFQREIADNRKVIVEYVWYVLGMGGLFGLPGVWAAAKRPILNRLKIILHSNGINNCDNVYGSDIKRLLNKSFSSAKTKFLFSN